MPTPSPYAQAVLDECLRQGAAISATQDAPCGMYSSSILKSLGLTFQGLVMTLSLTFAVITFVANSGASKSQFLVKMRSRMNLPFFLGAAIAYGSLIFIYQGPYTATVICAYWMREVGFAIHYGAVFLKILSELRYRPLLRLERISAGAIEDGAVSNNHHLSSTGNLSTKSGARGAPSAAASSLLPSTQVSTHHAWLRASNKLNQTRLNKSSLINFIYILLVPVVALSVWTAAFVSLPPGAGRRALCFAQPWTFVIEAFELVFIAFTCALSVRIVYKGGQSPRMYGPLFEIKLFKLLAVLLINEFILSSVFYAVRHASAVYASSDMMALAHMLRDNLTLTLNLMAVFIFKVAIRGGQMGSRTNLSTKTVTANKVASTAAGSVLGPNSAHNNATRPPSLNTVQQSTRGHGDDDHLSASVFGAGLGPEGEETLDAAQCIEIAELKRELRRVQMQAEYYRVKAMRKDNPHIPNTSSCSIKGASSPGANKRQDSAKNKGSESSRPPSNSNNNASVLNRVPPAPPTTSTPAREGALKSSLKFPSTTSSQH